MAFLTLTPERCVRALSIQSICTSCADVCPTSAIAMGSRLPSINHSQCVGCGGCVSSCPTEALCLDDFNPTDFFFAFAGEADNVVSCQKNLPCLVALSAEHTIALCGLKNGLVWDVGHCDECSIAPVCLPQIHQRAEECNYLLEAMESDARVQLLAVKSQEDKEEKSPDRRDFFKTFHLRKIGSVRADFEKEIQRSTDEFIEYRIGTNNTAGMRQKRVTERRKIFFTALKRLEKPQVYHVVDAKQIGFTSQKLLDEGVCNACEMCYRICPTGALVSDVRNSKIDFDPFLCVKCHLCHDVCEPDAITLSTSYNLKEWYEPQLRNLVTFSVRRCNECDALFSSVAGEKVCRRCRLEEEEARELWGI